VNQLQRHFMKQLKKLRESKGFSQEALAEKAGLSREYIARLEAGRQDPTLGTMGKLAKALKVRPAELME
jgi:transcriptional regulator with XRE-family HTH domain